MVFKHAQGISRKIKGLDSAFVWKDRRKYYTQAPFWHDLKAAKTLMVFSIEIALCDCGTILVENVVLCVLSISIFRLYLHCLSCMSFLDTSRIHDARRPLVQILRPPRTWARSIL
jgi:hypothetical protein